MLEGSEAATFQRTPGWCNPKGELGSPKLLNDKNKPLQSLGRLPIHMYQTV